VLALHLVLRDDDLERLGLVGVVDGVVEDRDAADDLTNLLNAVGKVTILSIINKIIEKSK
jgi:hypothetical protein